MLEVYFHGHSFVEIETEKGSILIDPIVEDNPLCDMSLKQIYSKNILAIINTHGHADHMWNTLDIVKEKECKVISTFEIIEYYRKEKWLTNLEGMHIWWEQDFWDFSVKFTQAVHWWGIYTKRWFLPGKAAWVVVRINEKNIYHAGDTALTYDMKLLWEYDNIDLAFLPIGDRFTMGVKDAVIATEFIKPKIVTPIHYDTWDPIKADAEEFAREVMKKSLAIPKVLKPGQSIVF